MRVTMISASSQKFPRASRPRRRNTPSPAAPRPLYCRATVDFRLNYELMRILPIFNMTTNTRRLLDRLTETKDSRDAADALLLHWHHVQKAPHARRPLIAMAGHYRASQRASTKMMAYHDAEPFYDAHRGAYGGRARHQQ